MEFGKLLASAAFVAVAFFGTAAQAATVIPAYSYSGDAQPLGNPPFTLGFQFATSVAITVGQLGILDFQGDGLSASHDIGLYNSVGSLLASTTIASGTAGLLLDGFRYADIAPVSLAGGQTYFLGALYIDGSDPVVFPEFGGLPVFSDEIIFTQATFASGNTLTVPTTIPASSGFGYFGPNLTYFVSGVPEPSTWAMMILGFGFVGFALRRKRKRLPATSLANC